MKINVALKEVKQVVRLKEIETETLQNYIKQTIRAPATKLKHPTLKGVFLLYHERKPSDPKDENFYLRNFFNDGKIKNKIIYGDAIFVKQDDNEKVINMTDADYDKLLHTFKNFQVLKEYINAGGNKWKEY